MSKIFKIILIVSMLFFTKNSFSQSIDSSYEVGTWKDFCKGAVSFTFDDNCANQLAVLMPMFDQYNFKMTFFTVINWGPDWTKLQAAASNGHEIASHTMSHSTLSSLSDSLQTNELKNSQETIDSRIKGQKCLTIAYPNCVLGNSSLISKYYIAGRGCSGAIVPKTPTDFLNISSIICGTQGSVQRTSDFESRMKAAASQNGWAVFLIHAVDNDPGYSPTKSSEVKGALEYLDQNRDKLWESSFVNVVRYIKERNNVSVTQVSEDDSLISFDVSVALNTSIYNFPLTIRRALPAGWASAVISQNGKTIDSKIVTVNDKNYVMFDVVPDSGTVQMEKDGTTGIMKNLKSQIINPHLMQNYPNPFNPTTVINYQLPKSGYVTLKVFDILGKEVAELVNEHKNAGTYQVTFNGASLPSGIYTYSIEEGSFSESKKMTLVK